MPGAKIAAAPAACSASKSCGGITPPTTTMMSVAAQRGQSLAQRGHQREVPGGERVDADHVHVGLDGLARDLAGVWNSGPTSTSKPRSANAVAITFWPRSWPSWPIFRKTN